MMRLDIQKRLARICGMFSSAHAGERAAAAGKADKLLRATGMTWADVFLNIAPSNKQFACDIAFDMCLELAQKGLLSADEARFVHMVRRQAAGPSPSQTVKLRGIVEQLHRRRAA